ncbi:MAG: helix-turn-helix domain-containing protein [Candidatus Kuenenia sp.]|nr:helix-turn-helix domain-containing protein [Candidatus Kuenenia hertensis]
MEKRYIDIKEVSEYTSLSSKKLYDWASQGKFPSIKCGSRVLFDKKDIDTYMESLKRISDSGKARAKKIIGDAFYETV